MGMSFGFAKTRKKNRETIEYECEICGAKVTAIGEVPRCLGCGKKMCNICGTHMLCVADFNLLNEKDQKKVKRAGASLESAKISKKMFTIMPIIFGV
jgi:hypothetical protein